MQVAWVGLGSNLDRPECHLERALSALAGLRRTRLLAASRRYRTTPVGGPSGQPDFCNACAAIATSDGPYTLLARLQAIEADHGRVRDLRWGPRTLDLDLLAYDDRRLDDPALTLPHPRAAERGFVLVPLAEIAPALRLAGYGRVAELAARVDTSGVALWQPA